MSKTKRPLGKPHFKNEQEEAQWWASSQGRAFLKRQPTAPPDAKRRGSPLVSGLNVTSSVQIALRLPAPDVAKAREIAERKGIGYQALLKMLIHEGRKEKLIGNNLLWPHASTQDSLDRGARSVYDNHRGIAPHFAFDGNAVSQEKRIIGAAMRPALGDWIIVRVARNPSGTFSWSRCHHEMSLASH